MALFNFHCFHFVLPPIRMRSFSNEHISIPFHSATSSSPSFHLRNANAISKKSNRRSPNPIRASSEGIPSEVIEDSKFVPLNADDPIYGPPALLLLGFEADETDKIQMLLKELDGEFLKVIHCTEDMMNQTVWDAMHTEQSNVEDVKIAKSLPRVCFLSGLTGEEMMMFIDAYPETGLKPAVFAALVPNSANKLLADVVEEIMGDHEMLVRNHIERTAFLEDLPAARDYRASEIIKLLKECDYSVSCSPCEIYNTLLSSLEKSLANFVFWLID